MATENNFKQQMQQNIITIHCRFLVPGNTQKILTEIWHHFWLKMMMKMVKKKVFWNSTVAFTLQRYLLTCTANSAFLDRFFALGSSNSEGHCGILKQFFLDHFSPIFSSQKWCQISIRIFCVLSGIRNLQYKLLF